MIPGNSYADPIWHKGYRVFFNDAWTYSGNAWCFVHRDYDGAPDAGDNRYGYGFSAQDCIDQIDDMEAA